jgi:hypothetical protein
MRSEMVELRAGRNVIAPGVEVELEPIDYFATEAEDTAEHESEHAGVGFFRGLHIKLASRIPGPGYLGITMFSKADAPSAAAAFAMGHSGTSHDERIVGLLDADLGSAAGEARRIHSKFSDFFRAFASMIQSKGSINHDDMVWAADKIQHPEAKAKPKGIKGERSPFIIRTVRGRGFFIDAGLLKSVEEPEDSVNLEEEKKKLNSEYATIVNSHPLRENVLAIKNSIELTKRDV